MHSQAIGLWFYIGARACYCGVLNSSSKRRRSFPPPGFVCAFTPAHAICSWCQISGTTETRTNAMTHWDFGKHLQGHRAARVGSQGAAHGTRGTTQHQVSPTRPSRQCSIFCKTFWEENWVSEEAMRRLSCHWGLNGWAGVSSSPWTPSSTGLTLHTRDNHNP